MADYANILTGGSNSFQTTAEHLNYHATDFISNGIVGAVAATSGVAPMTGGLAVNAQGTPDMTVAVTAGVAYLTATPTGQSSQRLRANIAAQNVTISANATGGTRYDWLYVKIDATNANTPNTAGDNVSSIVRSRSTSSSSDDGTPPTYGYNIAKITVANGAASITNGNIADTRSQTGADVPPGSITNADLAVNVAWPTFSPTITNMSVGNGTLIAVYNQVGKAVGGFVKVILGSTSTVGTQPTFTLPVAAHSRYATGNNIVGGCWMEDSGVSNYNGPVIFSNAGTSMSPFVINASGTYANVTAPTATVPFTWGTSDYINFWFQYEAA